MIYHKLILSIGATKICLIITDRFERSIDDFPLLRTFISKLPKEKIEEIMDSVAYACKINTRLINDKYFMMMRPGIKNFELAHESFHLALRILGGEWILKDEEKYAYLIQEIYEKLEKQIIKYKDKNRKLR